MSEEEAFLANMTASPTDNVARLVYADWLDERGDPRGEFLRVECALLENLRDSPRNDPLRTRYLALWVTTDPAWLRRVDRVAVQLSPGDWWEERERMMSPKPAPAHYRPRTIADWWVEYNYLPIEQLSSRKADLFCHLLLALCGPTRSANSLSATALNATMAEHRGLIIEGLADGGGLGSVAIDIRRMTPADFLLPEPRKIWESRLSLVLPCPITEEQLDCLRGNAWTWPEHCPLWLASLNERAKPS
jgi:uncharacterized protein (TIGR02996 family)